MAEMTHTELLNLGLEKYCEYLNTFTKDDLKPHTYTPTHFMIDDPDQGLYGSYDIQHVIHNWDHSTYHDRTTMLCSVYDGDDGGPTDLMMVFENHAMTVADDEGTWTCIYIVQGFDTMLNEVYNADKAKEDQ